MLGLPESSTDSCGHIEETSSFVSKASTRCLFLVATHVVMMRSRLHSIGVSRPMDLFETVQLALLSPSGDFVTCPYGAT